jgi:hypothetical protein
MSRSDFKLSEIRYPSDISDGSDASDISDSPSENEKQPLKIPEFATEAERMLVEKMIRHSLKSHRD